MKRCEEVVPLIGPLLDAALPDDDRAWVEDHVGGCASCRDRKALISAQGEALREALGRRAAAAGFDGFADRVMARIANDPGRAPVKVWGLEMWGAHRAAFTTLGGLAAAACIALAALLLPHDSGADDGAFLADAAAPQVDEVEFGTRDGAVFELPHETTVIWMSDDRPAVQR